MTPDPNDQRAQLDALHAAGVLTDPEYQDALTRVSPPAPPVVNLSPPPPVVAPDTPIPPVALAPAPDDASLADEPDASHVDVVDPTPVTEVPVSVPCPNCATTQVVVTTAPPTTDPVIGPDGQPLEAGQTIATCKHCSAILAAGEGAVQDVADELEDAYQRLQALLHPTPTPSPVEEVTNGTQT